MNEVLKIGDLVKVTKEYGDYYDGPYNVAGLTGIIINIAIIHSPALNLDKYNNEAHVLFENNQIIKIWPATTWLKKIGEIK